MGQPGTWWTLKAAADINGDGKADLFWESPDGWVVAWLSTPTGYNGVVIGYLGSWALRAAVDVDDGAVLNVGAGTHADEVGIAAQHAGEPDAAAGADGDIADDGGGGGDEGITRHLRPFALERIERRRAVMHSR